VQKRLSPVHGRELLGYTLEHFLNGRGVADERGRHLQASGRYVANGCFGVVRYPFDEEARVLRLHIKHLLIHLLHGHAATEDAGGRQVSAVPRVARGHHILGIEHLLDELGDGQGSVLLTAAGREWRETGDEEV